MADEERAPEVDIDDNNTGVLDTIDIDDEVEWEDEPTVIPFDKKASLQIAKWVLLIFAGVYLLCFVMAFRMMCLEGATFDGGLELVKFMLTSVLPLVTLAVGYYLGDRGRQDA